MAVSVDAPEGRGGEGARATAAKVAPNAGKVLALLFAANLLNFFDRAMPSVLIEEIREDFPLSDAQIGLVAAAFTLVYAVAGIPLGRLADRRSRRAIIGSGLGVWSLLTAASGAVTNFTGLLLTRVGVGLGEASYAPAANSLISDLYPSAQRSRAIGVFMLGLPLGLMLAYFTVGPIVEAFDSWRAPFFLAAIPGLVLAVALLRIVEPARGAADAGVAPSAPAGGSVLRLLRVRTLRWLVIAFLGYNFAAYAINAFCVPFLQRRFDLSLTEAGATTGLVLGLTGLIGLLVGGRLAERAARRSPRARVVVGAVCLAAAAPLTLVALLSDDAATFAVVFAAGWLLTFLFFTSCYPAISDVVAADRRASAVAVVFAAGYVLGGAVGPLIVGLLSDAFSDQVMTEAGATQLTDAFRGEGLQQALRIAIPSSLAVAAVAMWLASRAVDADANAISAPRPPAAAAAASVEVAAAPDAVWPAVSTAAGLSAWLAPAERHDGLLVLDLEDLGTARGRIVEEDEPRRFVWVEDDWRAGAPPLATGFEIEPGPNGGSRVTVRSWLTRPGADAPAQRLVAEANTAWDDALAALGRHVDGTPSN